MKTEPNKAMQQTKPAPVDSKKKPKPARANFWFNAAVIAAPAYYFVIVRPERKDEVTVIGWILGYLMFVLIVAWLLHLAKVVLASKLGRIAVLAYLTLALVGLFIVPLFSGSISFKGSGSVGLIVALAVFVKGVGVLVESWEDELKK